MTSKNKYIKTLDKFLDIMKSKSKPSFYENEKDQIAEDLITACRKADLYDELQSILEEYNVTHEILREVLLTGQMFRNQPTLSECVKEWKDRGYIVESEKITNGIYIYKNNKLKTKIVFIRKTKLKTKIKTTCRFFCIADYELLNLIHKTLKALENNNETK